MVIIYQYASDEKKDEKIDQQQLQINMSNQLSTLSTLSHLRTIDQQVYNQQYQSHHLINQHKQFHHIFYYYMKN